MSEQFEPRRASENASYEWADRDGKLHSMKATQVAELGDDYWVVEPKNPEQVAVADRYALPRAEKLIESRAEPRRKDRADR